MAGVWLEGCRGSTAAGELLYWSSVFLVRVIGRRWTIDFLFSHRFVQRFVVLQGVLFPWTHSSLATTPNRFTVVAAGDTVPAWPLPWRRSARNQWQGTHSGCTTCCRFFFGPLSPIDSLALVTQSFWAGCDSCWQTPFDRPALYWLNTRPDRCCIVLLCSTVLCG